MLSYSGKLYFIEGEPYIGGGKGRKRDEDRRREEEGNKGLRGRRRDRKGEGPPKISKSKNIYKEASKKSHRKNTSQK